MKITKQDFASIVLVVVFLLSSGQTFGGTVDIADAKKKLEAGESVDMSGWHQADYEALQASGYKSGWAALFSSGSAPTQNTASEPSTEPVNNDSGIGVPGFTPQYITNPTVTLPNGQIYSHNPLEYATPGTANTVAAMLGGVVGQSDWVGGPSTPSYGIYTAGGTYIGNAGAIANTLVVNDPLTALRMLTAWGADIPADSPLYLAAQAQLRNPNLANSGFTSPSQIPYLPTSLYGDVRTPDSSGVLGTPVTVPGSATTPGGGGGGGGIQGNPNYGGIGVPGFTPAYINSPFVTLPNGQIYFHNPLEYATLGTASTVAAMLGGVVRQSDWVGGPSTPSYGIYTAGGTYLGNAGAIANTIANNDPLTALRMLTAWGADVPADSPLYLAAQAQLRNPNLANSGFTSPSQIPYLPTSLYGDVRTPDSSGAGGCCGD